MLESKQISAYEDPSKTFQGVRFVLLGFDPVKKEKIQSKLFEGGGIDAVNYGSDCTHVIVDNLVYDDPVCVTAVRDRKTLVTALWVDHSFDVGMPVDPTSIIYRPTRDLNGIPGAKSMIVCLTGYQRQDRDDIMTMVSLMGANFSKPLVANKVTHLICYKFEGEKYELAKKMKKIKLVNHRWLEDCLKAWEVLPETDYAKSGYELELEAEAKDSEEETEDTEDMNFIIDTRRKSVVSPQNTQVENKISHQSPVKQDKIRNSSYLSASKSLGSIGDSSNIQATPRKASHFEMASFSRDNYDKRHEMPGSSSTRNPGKNSLEVPSSMHDGTPVSNKIENVLASVSKSAKKSPSADVPNKSFSRSSPRKCGLSLSSERMGNDLVGPSGDKVRAGNSLKMTLEIHEDGTVPHGEKTPQKGLDLQGQTALLPDKRKTPLSRASSKSFRLSHDFETLKENESTVSIKKMLASESSVDHSRGLAGPTSPVTGIHHLNEEASLASKEASKISALLKDGKQSNEVAPKSYSRGLKKRTLSTNLDVKDQSLRKISSEEPPNVLDDTAALDKVENILASVSESAKKPPSTASKSYIKSSPRSTSKRCSLSLSSERMENDLSKTPELKDLSLCRNGDSSGEVEMQRIEPPLLNPDISVDEREQADFKLSKSEQSVPQKNPPKKKMLAKKTLGARPTVGKGRAANNKGSINPQKAVLQNNNMIHSGETRATEETPCPAISEVLKVPQTTEANNIHELQQEPTDKDSPVDDETEDPDDKTEIELDRAIDKEKFGEVEVPQSENVVVSDAGKQSGGKITGTKLKGVKSVEGKKGKKAKKAVPRKKIEMTRSKSTGDAGERMPVKGRKRSLDKTENTKLSDPGEVANLNGFSTKHDEKKAAAGNEESVRLSGKTKTKTRPSKKFKSSADEDKENEPVTFGHQNVYNEIVAVATKASQPLKKSLRDPVEVKIEPTWFILSGHRLQRKEFQLVIKRLKGRVCRDSHHWSYQATHFIVPDPIRRTEKFFAAAASGSWILKMDYLTASYEAGKFLPEELYEWHKKCLSEDGAINLESPRKWRLLRERTGHGAFYGMRVVIYGECIAPPLDTLKRAIKAGEGTILATSPPYTRSLKSRIDFAIVSPGMPRVDVWVQEFIRAEVPCVLADYLVEYVCKPGYPLDRHVQYNTHALAEKSLKNLISRVEEAIDEPRTPEGYNEDDVACQVCESRERGDEMLICGNENGNLGCGVGIHLNCLDPPLEEIPDEDWFCPSCSKIRESKTVRKSSTKRSSKSKK